MVLVESIPEQMSYKGNVTFGLPLEKAWKTLIAMATDQVDLVSFYWTLTAEDISVNSSSDQPVRGPQTHHQTKTSTVWTWASFKGIKVVNAACNIRVCVFVCPYVSTEGTRHPGRTWGVALQEHQCPSIVQYSQCEGKLHRLKDLKTKRFVYHSSVFGHFYIL